MKGRMTPSVNILLTYVFEELEANSSSSTKPRIWSFNDVYNIDCGGFFMIWIILPAK
jgi:hypothetical protein